MKIFSLKTRRSTPAAFYVSPSFTTNILSEQSLYDLGYLKEEFLRGYGSQDKYIAKADLRTFGGEMIGEAVDVSNCSDCATTKPTKVNVNSGGKRHKLDRLKDACANSQRWEDGVLKCDCDVRNKALPDFAAVENIKDGGGHGAREESVPGGLQIIGVQNMHNTEAAHDGRAADENHSLTHSLTHSFTLS